MVLAILNYQLKWFVLIIKSGPQMIAQYQSSVSGGEFTNLMANSPLTNYSCVNIVGRFT